MVLLVINAYSEILNLITSKLSRSFEAEYIKVKGFYYLSFDFFTPPYPIVYKNGNYYTPTAYNEEAFLGHLIRINGKYFVVNADGHFVIKDSSVFEISSIKLEKTEDVIINYKVIYNECQLVEDKDNEKLDNEVPTIYPDEESLGKPHQIYCNIAPTNTLLNEAVSCIDIEGDCGCEILVTVDGIENSFWIGQTERLYLEGNITKVVFNSFKFKDAARSRDFYINYQTKEE